MQDITEMKPFWVVYRLGQGGPTYQHGTEAAALREAERLAEVRPGVTFVVMEATQAVRTRRLDYFDLRTAPHTDGRRTRHKDSEDDIPFSSPSAAIRRAHSLEETLCPTTVSKTKLRVPPMSSI